MSGFRSQIEGMINEKLGTNSNRTINGIVTKKVDDDKCTVCPIDIDMIWEMKSYYNRTKIDRASSQNLIESVSINKTAGIKTNDISVGDKVCVGYSDDVPYIVQKISSPFGINTASSTIKTIDGKNISMDSWLTDDNDQYEFDNFSPLTNESTSGVQ